MNHLERHIIHSLRQSAGFDAIFSGARQPARMRGAPCYSQSLDQGNSQVLRMTLR
jgi:hypothetical protein